MNTSYISFCPSVTMSVTSITVIRLMFVLLCSSKYFLAFVRPCQFDTQVHRAPSRVADPDPVILQGSGVFAWIRIRIQIRFSNFSGSGSESGFQISLDPEPGPVSAQKKIAERSLKVIYQKKT